jgi:hypothetical protein
MSNIAPRSSEKAEHSNVKPFSGTLRVPNPARQSRTPMVESLVLLDRLKWIAASRNPH